MGFVVDEEQISLRVPHYKSYSTNDPYLLIHLSPMLYLKPRN